MVRARGDGRGGADLPGLAGVRSLTGADFCRGQRGGGTDHRLSVCHGPGHADFDHGRHRPRRRAGRAVPQRPGAAAAARGPGGGGGQDRHADRGPSAVDRPGAGRRFRARRRAATGGGGGIALRASDRPRHRGRRRGRRDPGAGAGGFRIDHRHGRARQRRWSRSGSGRRPAHAFAGP